MPEMKSKAIDAFIDSRNSEPAVIDKVKKLRIAVALSGIDIDFAGHLHFVFGMAADNPVHHVAAANKLSIDVVAGHAVVCLVEVLPVLRQVNSLMAQPILPYHRLYLLAFGLEHRRVGQVIARIVVASAVAVPEPQPQAGILHLAGKGLHVGNAGSV